MGVPHTLQHTTMARTAGKQTYLRGDLTRLLSSWTVVMASCSSDDHTVRLKTTISVMNTVSHELVLEQVPKAAKRGRLIFVI